MENTEHSLTPIWEKYPKIFSSDNTTVDPAAILDLISEIFIASDYYYYLIDIQKHELTHQHPNICELHGLTTIPTRLQEIIDLIHPDDIPFVLAAEDASYGKVVEIGAENLKSLKSCYCFRMRTADGSYRLFHHQAITLISDQQNRIVRSLNIHTDISHLSPSNNYIATIMGIHERNDFYQIDLSTTISTNEKTAILTKRELQCIPYIAQGMSSGQIAEKLHISPYNVRVHRKNILRKTNSRNSSSLIKRCIELGILSSCKILDAGFAYFFQ